MAASTFKTDWSDHMRFEQSSPTIRMELLVYHALTWSAKMVCEVWGEGEGGDFDTETLDEPLKRFTCACML